MEGWKQGLQRPFILAFFTASSLPASPPRWQQLASNGVGSPILEKVLLMSRHFPGTGFSSLNHRDQDSWRWRELQGSTTDLQPWLVGCVNKFFMCIVPQAHLDETFCRPPPPGLGSCPPLLYCRSQLGLLPWTGALGHLGADVGPGLQFCEHVNCLWILQLSGFPPNLLKVFTWPWAWCDWSGQEEITQAHFVVSSTSSSRCVMCGDSPTGELTHHLKSQFGVPV